MRINHNISALNTHRQMTMNTVNQGKNMEKLASGLRINRAGDDAAGLSISEKMRGQIRGLEQASRNAQDGISFIQTAEGALNEVSDMLVRLKELTVQKANGTNSTADTNNLDLEMTQLGLEVDKIINKTEFNTATVFTATKDIVVSDDDTDTFAVGVVQAALGLSNASKTADVETAIDTINTSRSTLGSQQNRLEHTINNLGTTSENLTAAESRIRDVDMAKEMMNQTKNSILSQAAQAMLAQANQQPQGVLQLLR
ncbi:MULTISPECIES: flagellin [unclassified Bacillus (in: firmicutes)]|uniref:flagellin N-terminal helical domain-containing protein n=1 Tax=unclassified Bacillus (in: firmicutes) TaxID=185979 RepID=UPI0008EBBFFF|nr:MULTISPECIES: flagellin [unclassified Bacillus (in: firmicutes)]SFB25282.1 flagellin [Bacillus sp. UNCCL13]SFQ91680.1 flagellin [Bacillus sp. cl95]